MNPTPNKEEENKPPEDLDNFEQFVRAIWSVTPEDIEEQNRKELAKQKEEEKPKKGS